MVWVRRQVASYFLCQGVFTYSLGIQWLLMFKNMEEDGIRDEQGSSFVLHATHFRLTEVCSNMRKFVSILCNCTTYPSTSTQPNPA